MSDYLNLGWQNDWDWSGYNHKQTTVGNNRDTLPFEYVRCCDAGHKRREENIGKCQRQVYCDICWITWKVDSGD